VPLSSGGESTAGHDAYWGGKLTVSDRSLVACK